MKREPRLLHVDQRNATLVPCCRLNDDDFSPRWTLRLDRNDFGLEPAAVFRRKHVHPSSNEPPPLSRSTKWPLAWRRHLQHVLRCNETTAVETTFDSA